MPREQQPILSRLTVRDWLMVAGICLTIVGSILVPGYRAFQEHDRKLVRLETQMEQVMRLCATSHRASAVEVPQ